MLNYFVTITAVYRMHQQT